MPVLRWFRRPGRRLTLVALATLSACGGGGPDDAGAINEPDFSPVYHVAPLLPPEPDGLDVDGLEGSASRAPLRLVVSGRVAAQGTAGAVPQELLTGLETAALAGEVESGRVAAQATTTTATVYTPAQIRAAYGLSKLPSQPAYLGAGQTIYLINAYHNPNIANDLAVFSSRFGLPACQTLVIPPGASLPLAAASTTAGCTLSVVYAVRQGSSGVTGAMTATAPAVSRSWVTESTLDVQWAHAIAPRARLVLIEAASSRASDLMAAVDLANRMGPGVVSMSFGAPEFDLASMRYWSVPLGANARSSYVAANGDWGSQVMWPAVDAQVLAVGGTRLSWNGTSRSETAWSSGGGATSTRVPVPAYQAAIIKPGDPTAAGATRYRGSTDIAFNADPYTGQYVYVTPSSVTGGSGWIVAGGTSIGSPQWAGLLSVANAVRAQAGKAPLGQVHQRLYGRLGTGTSYAQNFTDITSGSNGTCGAMCSTATRYDLPTGLGTPNAAALIAALVAD